MKVRLRSLLSRGRDGNSGNPNKKKSGASKRSLAFLAKAKAKSKSTCKDGGSGLLDGVTVGVVEGGSCGGNANAFVGGGVRASSSPEVDTSIETTLDSVADLLNTTDNDNNADGGKAPRLGPERTVTFHSSNLGLRLARGPDGRVRVRSLTPSATKTDPTMSGTIRTGDVVLEMAGMDLRRPIDATGWSRAASKVKRGTERPVTFVVAEERPASGINKETKLGRTTVPAVEIEVDLADAASTSMDIRTSDTWEMEQSKAEWVEAEKGRQLEEEKARLMGTEATAEANDDSVEMGLDELRRMLDGAAGAVADMFGAGTQGAGKEKKEEEEEAVAAAAKEAKASVPPTTGKGCRLISNPIDLDEIPSDLSSIGNGNVNVNVDNNDNGNGNGNGNVDDNDNDNDNDNASNASNARRERQAMLQAANRSGGNAEGTADNGGEKNGNGGDGPPNADNDDDEGLIELNRINTALFERLRQGQQPMAAREITGMSSLGRDRSIAGQSLTGSYTDVSENHMMESFLFLNRDAAAAAPDDDTDNDYDEGRQKEANKKNGVAIGKQRGNNHDFFEEEDDYANCNDITCHDHLVNRIDDIVCSGVVCIALPVQLLGSGDEDDEDDDDEDEDEVEE